MTIDNVQFTLAKSRLLFMLNDSNKVTKKDMLILVRKAYQHLKKYEEKVV